MFSCKQIIFFCNSFTIWSNLLAMVNPEETLKESLEKAAKEKDYENCQITIKAISSEGANYTSFLYLATLQAPGKEDLKIFAKIAAVGEKARAKASFKIYESESFFYNKLLKKYKQLEDKKNIPAEHRLETPIYYGGTDEYLKETVILEDVTTKGFTTHDRFTSIDWKYASKSIEALAKLHALSITYFEDDPEAFDVVSVLNDTKNFSPMLDNLENIVSNALQLIREENRDRVSKFTNELMRQKDFDIFFRYRRRRVIIHGDYRPSNIMHRRVAGNMEVVPVDYQTLQIGNPIIDIIYYIFNGSDKNFRDQYFQTSLEHYYEELCKALRRFGHNPEDLYPREDFDFELKEILPVGLVLCMFSLLLVTAETDGPKVNQDVGLEDYAINPNTLYAERLNDIVDDYIKMGII